MDCIATDHAPHTVTEKDVEFQLAPFGIVGLETSLGVVLAELVEPGIITLEYAIDLMTRRGAEIVGIDAGILREGGPADVTVFDRNESWTVDPNAFASRSRNTPFAGRSLPGTIKTTVCAGTVVHQN